MSYLYLTDQGASLGFDSNRFQVKYRDGLLTSIPAESLEVIEIFGRIQISARCIEECLKRGINIIFFSTSGSYYGRLISTNHVNVERQRKQAELGADKAFNLRMAKKIIDAKIRNQIVILRRYARRSTADVSTQISDMRYSLDKVARSTEIDQLMGYEGYAARQYFQALGKLITPEFAFEGRNRRPPKDPFNSLISLGYSIILNELYGKIEAKGLNPYFGFLHSDREKHPTLASDLMEEWRAVLIDSTAMSLLNGKELLQENFYLDTDNPGVYLTRDGFKTYIKKLEGKFRTRSNYLSYVDYSVHFRKALSLQVNQYVKALESGDPEQYHPIMIR